MSSHAKQHTLGKPIERMLGHLARNDGLYLQRSSVGTRYLYIGKKRKGLPTQGDLCVNPATVETAWKKGLFIRVPLGSQSPRHEPTDIGIIIGRLVNQRDALKRDAQDRSKR